MDTATMTRNMTKLVYRLDILHLRFNDQIDIVDYYDDPLSLWCRPIIHSWIFLETLIDIIMETNSSSKSVLVAKIIEKHINKTGQIGIIDYLRNNYHVSLQCFTQGLLKYIRIPTYSYLNVIEFLMKNGTSLKDSLQKEMQLKRFNLIKCFQESLSCIPLISGNGFLNSPASQRPGITLYTYKTIKGYYSPIMVLDNMIIAGESNLIEWWMKNEYYYIDLLENLYDLVYNLLMLFE